MTTNNLMFPGQYEDAEVGSRYNFFRDYEPPLGRYVQSDPIGLKGGMNTYIYTNQRPIISTDFSGLKSGAGSDGGNAGGWPVLHPSCLACPMNDEIKNKAKAACDLVDKIVTSPKLASCIKRRCQHAVIRCDSKDCNPNDGGINITSPIFGPEKDIYLCVGNPNLSAHLGPVVIHEFAHSCGWKHGGGFGVPGDSGGL